MDVEKIVEIAKKVQLFDKDVPSDDVDEVNARHISSAPDLAVIVASKAELKQGLA